MHRDKIQKLGSKKNGALKNLSLIVSMWPLVSRRRSDRKIAELRGELDRLEDLMTKMAIENAKLREKLDRTTKPYISP